MEGVKLKEIDEYKSVEVGEGKVGFSLHSYFEHEKLDGYQISLNNDGASTSGVEYINIDQSHLNKKSALCPPEAHHKVTVKWGDTFYTYRDADVTLALAVFTATNSLGKTANVIKQTGTLERTYNNVSGINVQVA